MLSIDEDSSSPQMIIRIKIHVGASSILGLKVQSLESGTSGSLIVNICRLQVIWDTYLGLRQGRFSQSGKTDNFSLWNDELVTRIEGTTMGSWNTALEE